MAKNMAWHGKCECRKGKNKLCQKNYDSDYVHSRMLLTYFLLAQPTSKMFKLLEQMCRTIVDHVPILFSSVSIRAMDHSAGGPYLLAYNTMLAALMAHSTLEAAWPQFCHSLAVASILLLVLKPPPAGHNSLLRDNIRKRCILIIILNSGPPSSSHGKVMPVRPYRRFDSKHEHIVTNFVFIRHSFTKCHRASSSTHA